MAKLSSIVDNAEKTWGPSIDKREAPQSFYIHGLREGIAKDTERGEVPILVLNCSPDAGAKHEDQRFVITLGDSEARRPLVEYFENGQTEPIGPVRLIQTNLSGGRTFWRMEDAE